MAIEKAGPGGVGNSYGVRTVIQPSQINSDKPKDVYGEFASTPGAAYALDASGNVTGLTEPDGMIIPIGEKLSISRFLTEAQKGRVRDRVESDDLSVAIQLAIDELASRASGGVLHFPAGLYGLSGVEISTQNISLTGDGMGLIYGIGATTLKLSSGSNKSILRIKVDTSFTDASSGAIRHMCFDGNRDNQTIANHGIEWEAFAPQNVESTWIIEQVRTTYCKGTGFYQGLNRRGMRFLNTVAWRNTGDGYSFGGSDNLASGCMSGDNTGYGFSINNHTTRVIDSDIWGNQTGIFVNSGSTKHTAIICNRIDDNLGPDVFVNAGTGIGGDVPAGTVQIIGNAFHRSQLAGPHLAPAVYLGGSNCVVTGNTFDGQPDGAQGNASYSIYEPVVAGVTGNQVFGNTFTPLANWYGNTNGNFLPISSEPVPVYANNAAAITGGLTVGRSYRTGADPDPLCTVH